MRAESASLQETTELALTRLNTARDHGGRPPAQQSGLPGEALTEQDEGESQT